MSLLCSHCPLPTSPFERRLDTALVPYTESGVSSCTLALGMEPLPWTHWDELATHPILAGSRVFGFTAHGTEIPVSTFKDAAPLSDSHGNLGRPQGLVMTCRPFPGELMGTLFYSTSF